MRLTEVASRRQARPRILGSRLVGDPVPASRPNRNVDAVRAQPSRPSRASVKHGRAHSGSSRRSLCPTDRGGQITACLLTATTDFRADAAMNVMFCVPGTFLTAGLACGYTRL